MKFVVLAILIAAVLAQKPEDLSVFDCKGNIIDGALVTIQLYKVFDLYHVVPSWRPDPGYSKASGAWPRMILSKQPVSAGNRENVPRSRPLLRGIACKV